MGGLDCVSCVSDGLRVCSFVSLVVLCVFHLLRFVCDPRVAPPGWARPSDLRAFAAYQAPGVGVGA